MPCCQVAAELAQVGGVSKLLVAEDAALDGLLAERVTPVLLAAQKQFNFSHIIGESGAHTAHGAYRREAQSVRQSQSDAPCL